MKKKYNVTIEQPMTFTLSIEAENMEAAQEIAAEQFDKMTREEFDHRADFGTEAQALIESEDGTEIGDWNDL